MERKRSTRRNYFRNLITTLTDSLKWSCLNCNKLTRLRNSKICISIKGRHLDEPKTVTSRVNKSFRVSITSRISSLLLINSINSREYMDCHFMLMINLNLLAMDLMVTVYNLHKNF
jgi:hypothetical protein